jgi:hypothetical protein
MARKRQQKIQRTAWRWRHLAWIIPLATLVAWQICVWTK